MLSEPTSPIRGVTPKWLQQAPRGVSGARYVAKVLAMAMFCIFLGISLSSLYDAAGPRYRDHSYSSLETETLGIGRGKYSGIESEPPSYLYRGSSHSTTLLEDGASKVPPEDSMVRKLADKMKSWKSWGKATGAGQVEEDVVAAIYAHKSAKQTKEVIITPWNASSIPPSSPPTLAKVTIVTGGSNSIYERALRTHTAHNQRHGYPMHTLRQSILNDVWSKPAYILSVLLRELAKPEHERLRWLFWVDADTIVINPHVPAETFLPPAGWADDVHLLVAHDFNGLNNGVFPLRVCPWSVELLTAVLSYPFYRPDEYLLFRDQSAMARVLEDPRFARHTVRTPQRWFNAYQGEINETIAPFQTRPGDLLVHFAGVPDRDARMLYWLERAEEHLPEWEIQFKHTSYRSETREFWEGEKRRREAIKKAVATLRTEMDKRREALKHGLKKWGDALSEEERRKIDDSLVAVYRAFDDDNTALSLETLKKKISKFKEASKPLHDRQDNANKLLLREAHEVLFKAESLIVSLQPTPATEEDLHKLENAINSFKDVLLAPVFLSEKVEEGMRTVQQRQQDVKKKLEALEREAEEANSRRLRESEEAKADAQRKAELELANAERMRAEKAVAETSGANVDGNASTMKKEADTQREKTDNPEGQGQDDNRPSESSSDDTNAKQPVTENTSKSGSVEHKEKDGNEKS